MHHSVPAVLLSLVYAAAIAVAVTDPSRHALAGLVVLTGLVARWAIRHRHRSRVAQPAVVPEPAVAPAAAA